MKIMILLTKTLIQIITFQIQNSFGLFLGFHTITSPFGKRISPTTGASSNHSGIDIAAHEESTLYSVISGKVTFVGFNGANGCTITVQNGNLEVSYCHVSPNYIISVGDTVNSGEKVGNVGPKYVYGIPNNPYHDSNGNPTNRCYYRMSSSFNNKKRRHSRQSFRFFLNSFHV